MLMFACSVVIKKNTPGLREKLRSLGVRENTLDLDIENPEMWLVSNRGVYVARRPEVELGFLECTNQKDPGDVDILCEEGEDGLFLELAGLRKDMPGYTETTVADIIKRYRG